MFYYPPPLPNPLWPTDVFLSCNSYAEIVISLSARHNNAPSLIFSHSICAFKVGDTFRMGRLPRLYFLPMVLGDTNETETTQKKKKETQSERLKARHGERQSAELFLAGVFLHTRSRFSGLLLFRTVGVKKGWVLIWFDCVTFLPACVCVYIEHASWYPGGFPVVALVSFCFDQLAPTPNICRAQTLLKASRLRCWTNPTSKQTNLCIQFASLVQLSVLSSLAVFLVVQVSGMFPLPQDNLKMPDGMLHKSIGFTVGKSR